MLKRRLAVAIALLIAVTAAGCGRDPASDGAAARVLRRDSAGIEIVINSTPGSGAQSVWGVDTNPLIDIGSSSGPPDQLLDTLAAAVRLADGRIVVVEPAARFLFFDSTGKPDTIFSRRGDGPGEFRSVQKFFRYPGDSLLVLWGGGGSVTDAGSTMWTEATFMDSRGSFGRLARLGLTTPAGRGMSFMGSVGIEAVTADGAFVLRRWSSPELKGTPGRRWARDPYAVMSANGSRIDTITILPTTDVDEIADRKSVVPFFRRRALAATVFERLMYWGNADTFEIHVFDLSRAGAGMLQPVRIVRYDLPNAVVTNAVRERYLQLMLAKAITRGDTLAYHESHCTRPARPDIPAFQTLIPDPDGNIWVEHTRINAYAGMQDDPAEPNVWTVFDSTGALIGDVRTPFSLKVRQIGRDWILGTWADGDGVQHVRLHRLRK